MFRNAHFERVRKMFADQFEPDGTGYIYRKSLRGPPIRVSAAERDQFIAKFAKDQRRLSWISVALIVLGIGALVILVPSFAPYDHDPLMYAVIAVAIAVSVIPWLMIWGAPARALERRPTIGVERTRAEAGRIMIANMSWGQLLAITAGGGFAWWSFAPDNSEWVGWRIIWIAVGVFLLGGMAWRAWQKFNMRSPGQ